MVTGSPSPPGVTWSRKGRLASRAGAPGTKPENGVPSRRAGSARLEAQTSRTAFFSRGFRASRRCSRICRGSGMSTGQISWQALHWTQSEFGKSSTRWPWWKGVSTSPIGPL